MIGAKRLVKSRVSGRYYEQLIVWQRSDEFLKLIYKTTVRFPSDEKFGVTSQLRRAALSIVLNIVEGQARGSNKDFRRFLIIARASLAECTYLLDFAKEPLYSN